MPLFVNNSRLIGDAKKSIWVSRRWVYIVIVRRVSVRKNNKRYFEFHERLCGHSMANPEIQIGSWKFDDNCWDFVETFFCQSSEKLPAVENFCKLNSFHKKISHPLALNDASRNRWLFRLLPSSQPKAHPISKFYYRKSAETTSFDLRSSLSHIIQQTPGCQR